LPAIHPHHGQQIERGHIYIAPPDHHLLVERGPVQLWRGPKENWHRPSINALFRSAAIGYGKRTVVGVVLSGLLDDGATGLWWIKRFSGVAVVQDLQECLKSAPY
jgi:two-component system chemotaxis response regulator CheB